MFFPLWKVENLEEYLEEMEKNGYRLNCVKYSYCFHFVDSMPKEMHYFLTYKSFRGKSMSHWDYALLSEHQANEVQTKMCFYSVYRTKDQKENLSFLMKSRMAYLRGKLLENALTSLLVTTLLTVIFVASSMTKASNMGILFMGIFTGIAAFFSFYYFFGYFKYRNKCKKREKNKLG